MAIRIHMDEEQKEPYFADLATGDMFLSPNGDLCIKTVPLYIADDIHYECDNDHAINDSDRIDSPIFNAYRIGHNDYLELDDLSTITLIDVDMKITKKN